MIGVSPRMLRDELGTRPAGAWTAETKRRDNDGRGARGIGRVGPAFRQIADLVCRYNHNIASLHDAGKVALAASDHAPLAGVEVDMQRAIARSQKRRLPAHGIAFRRLNLHHFGAKVGEKARTE